MKGGNLIKIITDSTANLSKEVIDRYQITVISSYIFFGKEEYKEGTISYEDFCNKLLSSKENPMTAPPSSAEFVKFYLDVSKDADTIFSLHLSSRVSNIYKNASIGANTFNNQKREKPCEVIVFDTKTIDLGLGMIVLRAAKASKEGKSKEDIQKLLNLLIDKIRVYFYVDKLDFLIRGGRVSKIAGFLGGLLNMKPILAMEQGDIVSKDKIRGKEAAQDAILSLMEKDIKPGSKIKVGVSDCLVKEEGDKFLNVIKSKFNCVETFRSNLSTSVSVHLGPGALGVFFISAEV